VLCSDLQLDWSCLCTCRKPTLSVYFSICRSFAENQSSVAPERRWHIVQWVSAVAKDISVWSVGARRSVKTSPLEVTKVVAGCFAVLHQLNSICRSVSRESLMRLVVSLVVTQLDYCNAVLAGLPAYQLDRLQSAINAVARMIYRASRYDHVSSLLKELYWLRVPWVQALCTRTQVTERLWTSLRCWQSSTSDGRQVTSTPAVIFVVITSRPGDTLCNSGRPCVSGRRRLGLERPSRLRHVIANLLIIPYCVEDISVFQALQDWQHASHWLCNVVLRRCCACSMLILSYDDDDDDDD